MSRALHLTPARAAQLFKLLGDERRLLLVLLLAEQGERSITALVGATGQSQPAVSRSLGLLRRGGVVECRRRGQSSFCTLAAGPVRDLIDALGLRSGL